MTKLLRKILPLLLATIILAPQLRAQEITAISGRVVNSQNKRPIENATVSVPGTNISTVTNADGRFTLKIPEQKLSGGIRAFQLGFKSHSIGATDISPQKELVIALQPLGKMLKEVEVKGADPRLLVYNALKKIPDNYSDRNNLFTGFYRETLQKGNRFIGISEAILHVLKRPYRTRYTSGEKVHIHKGRKLLSQNLSDTLAVKLSGGPYMAVFLDAVKNGDHLFTVDELDNFDFRLEKATSIDDRPHFTVSFTPRAKFDYPLYKGRIYIDMETSAMSRIEFQLDMTDKDKVTRFVLRKRPAGLRFSPQEVSGTVTYKLVDGKSYLNYISSTMRFKCDWKKRLFSSGYTTHAEIVMVDRDDNPEKNLKFADTFGQQGVFTDIVDNYWEENFWRDYNIIEPTESLEKAVDRLKKR